jgi:hypothetical protein
VTVVGVLELVRGNIPERLQQAPRVIPCDPFQCRELDLLHPLPWPAVAGVLYALTVFADPDPDEDR